MEKKPDRRIERTRKQLLDAFRDLVLERGFSRLTVGDVIDRANVGRSTFYEHFESKDDILQQSIAPLFTVLAQTVDDPIVSTQLVGVVTHFAENARTSRFAFSGSSGRALADSLADLIEARLQARIRTGSGRPIIPVDLAAKQLARAQLVLLEEWVGASNGCTAQAVAAALALSTHAAASAMLSG